jgi:hypothetical protein
VGIEITEDQWRLFESALKEITDLYRCVNVLFLEMKEDIGKRQTDRIFEHIKNTNIRISLLESLICKTYKLSMNLETMGVIPKNKYQEINNKLFIARQASQHIFSDKIQVNEWLRIKAQINLDPNNSDVQIQYGRAIFFLERDIKFLINVFIDLINPHIKFMSLEKL